MVWTCICRQQQAHRDLQEKDDVMLKSMRFYALFFIDLIDLTLLCSDLLFLVTIFAQKNMEERYCRNRLYVLQADQTLVKSKRIFLGGAGIGSIIAECAVRFGFEKITIVDGDIVEESNLNRQNYCQKDIGRYKAEVLSERLLSINSHAEIDSHLLKVMNLLGIKTHQLGHPVEYLGSLTIPIYSNKSDLLEYYYGNKKLISYKYDS